MIQPYVHTVGLTQLYLHIISENVNNYSSVKTDVPLSPGVEVSENSDKVSCMSSNRNGLSRA